MSEPTRRRILRHSALAGGTALAVATADAVPAFGRARPATAAVAAGRAAEGGLDAITVRPADSRYQELIRGTNQRWVGRPDYVRLVYSADQVVDAVREAVTAGKRVAVRSGGHCYEGFTTDPEIKVVIDLSELTDVSYDAGRRVFVVEPGAWLSDVYCALFKRWGVTLPGGSCPSVAAGGHIVGGGYGALSRMFGLTVDHLYGVEVVVVGKDGTVRKVVATRDSDDPDLRDLWWAHTGGGGGNFGIVTKYLLRTAGATGTDPSQLLPRPPAELLTSTVTWSWEGMTQAAFKRLVKNYGDWFAAHGTADSSCLDLFSQLKATHRSGGALLLVTQIDATRPNAQRDLDAFVAAVGKGVPVTPTTATQRLPFLHATRWPGFAGGDPTLRFEDKSAYMRASFPEDQLNAMYKHLTRTDYANPAALLLIAGYGGRINAVDADATAVAQRDSVMKLQYLAFWQDPAEDAKHLAWVREFYRDVYASTGGVPTPGRVTDGCFVNYADIDLSDPDHNKSGVPWHALYYKDNYPRLQKAKATWDPRGVLRHAQSVKPQA
ncbi:FAD-binding oxidoreductase [Streptomyces luteocolor]|uniref:FAD-binding oxidoreductase n=1 Tax=Streptomyces luteocolor TaxID=285500 RepID=UPI000852E4F0|nr:FAD-binding protein [Streptomyces luteocolor]